MPEICGFPARTWPESGSWRVREGWETRAGEGWEKERFEAKVRILKWPENVGLINRKRGGERGDVASRNSCLPRVAHSSAITILAFLLPNLQFTLPFHPWRKNQNSLNIMGDFILFLFIKRKNVDSHLWTWFQWRRKIRPTIYCAYVEKQFKWHIFYFNIFNYNFTHNQLSPCFHNYFIFHYN